MTIRAITPEHISHWKKSAQEADLTFCKQTHLYGVWDEENLVGFFGILGYSNKNIVKNIYIPPGERGKGYFKAMMDWCMVYEPHKRKEASCTPMSIREFIARGFVVGRKYKNGITKVYYENL
jgi:hypothetical protein